MVELLSADGWKVLVVSASGPDADVTVSADSVSASILVKAF